MKNRNIGINKDFVDQSLIAVSSLSNYTYCPRRLYLSQVKGIRKETSHSVAGKIEHDARRIICPQLKHKYLKLTNNKQIVEFENRVFQIIDRTMDYIRKVAFIEFPIFTPEIQFFIEELDYRLKSEEERRVQTLTNLFEMGKWNKSKIYHLLPWLVEHPVASKDLQLKGRIDQVFLEEERAIPVDIKTTPYPFISREADAVQIGAYSLLLEKVWGREVRKGQIYYSRSFLHYDVRISDELRNKVIETRNCVRRILEMTKPPPPLEGHEALKCRFCYLRTECQTETLINEEQAEVNGLCKLFTDPAPGNLDSLFMEAKVK